jgi:hypothetical protein
MKLTSIPQLSAIVAQTLNRLPGLRIWYSICASVRYQFFGRVYFEPGLRARISIQVGVSIDAPSPELRGVNELFKDG